MQIVKLGLCALSLVLLLACPGDKKRPRPPAATSTPTPATDPTPTPAGSPRGTPTPTPYPTPSINPDAYLPSPPTGSIVTITGENLTEKLQAAQDDPTVGTVIVGGGSLTRPTIWRKHTKIVSTPENPLKCDITEPLPQYARLLPLSDYGCVLLADGAYVEGNYRAPKELLDWFKFGNPKEPLTDPYFQKLSALTDEQIAGPSSTILGSNHVSGYPQVAVFQTLGDVEGSHTGKAANIHIKGVVIKGRQKLYDGGVRSTIQLGNCHNCSVQQIFLWGTDSIGVSAGGSARETGNHSFNVLFHLNIFSRVPAANAAAINSQFTYLVNNYIRTPGRTDADFKNLAGERAGAGICGFDLETNDPDQADHSGDTYALSNLIDFEGAFQENAGNGLCLQDPYAGPNRGKGVAADNTILGGRPTDTRRYLSNGLFLNGLRGWDVIGNYVFKAAQNGAQIYNIESCLIQHNIWDSVGGGGSYHFHSTGMKNTTVRENTYVVHPDTNWSVLVGIIEQCGSGNVYEGNTSPGHTNLQPSKRCP